MITYGEVTKSVMRVDGDYDHEATISPLLACTNYTIDIYAVNAAELQSPKVTMYAATAETGEFTVLRFIQCPVKEITEQFHIR